MGHGVDSEPEGWLTDYALCATMFSFAASLYAKGASGHAVRTQLFMSFGYLFGALGHHVFPYRAYTDVCGLRAFYIVWALAYGSQVTSCISWCLWCDSQLSWHISRVPMLVLCTLATALAALIAAGCAACVATVMPPGSKACDGSGPPQCDTVIFYGEGLFYLVWGWAWALVGTRIFLLLRSVRRDEPAEAAASALQFFWFSRRVSRATRFLLLHLANALAPLALLTFGPFLILYVAAYSAQRGLEVTEVYTRNRIAIVYHAGVITTHWMTYYLALNVPPVRAAARSKAA